MATDAFESVIESGGKSRLGDRYASTKRQKIIAGTRKKEYLLRPPETSSRSKK